jgi:hypothetical protein
MLTEKNANALAKQMLKKGYNVIPTNASKQPIGINWNRFQKNSMEISDVDNYFKSHYNIAMLTGGPSRVVCLDGDMKYDLTGDLWERFMGELPNELKEKVYIQATQNKGYHIVFKAPSNCLLPNEKLASRYTTAEEKHQTYMEAFKDPETRDSALKAAINDKQRVLFETRSGTAESCGGYFLIAPSDGYTRISGKIGEVNEEEYDLIMSLARSFNEVKVEYKPRDFDSGKIWVKSPFEDYNERCDVLALLSDNGWSILDYGKKKDIQVLRPGKTYNKYSAVFDKETKILNVYTTSTSFDVKGYTPSGVFIELECDGDSGEAFRRLVNMGYGDSE